MRLGWHVRVWLVTIGEPVPLQEGARDRLHRTGSFAFYLAGQGHDVTWWTSTFDHFRKRHLFPEDAVLRAAPRLEIRLLHGCGYARNGSLRRLRDHRQIAAKFAGLIAREAVPDVIVAALPTVELCHASTVYGLRHNVPVVLDVRDLWPDVFVQTVPGWAAPLARMALKPLFRQARQALRQATGIMGVSEGYLQWGLAYAGRERRAADRVFPLGYRRPAIAAGEVEAAGAELRARGVDPQKVIGWFVGMFGRTYDLRTVVAAARILAARQVRDVQFVLSGSGEDEAELRTLAQGLESVVFTGWVNAAQIAYLMRSAGIGLMAYAVGAPQGYPNKLFEYLCAGLPIISSLQGETAALLEQYQCGLTYRAGDAGHLADLLDAFLRDPERRRALSANSARLFAAQFDAEKIYPEMMAYLQQWAGQ